MPKQRSNGDGALYWDDNRQRWIAAVTIGYSASGKRIVRKASGTTKTAARDELKKLLRDREDGVTTCTYGVSVADAVNDWLEFGQPRASEATRKKCRSIAANHIVPKLGGRRLGGRDPKRELTADDVDRWLHAKAPSQSTDSLRQMRSILGRSVKRAQARDKVRRNVVALTEVPQGRDGRPSKSFTFEQAEAVLSTAEKTPMYAYIALSLLIGARTEELRALTWTHVDLAGRPAADPPVPPSIRVWRSVRATGDTKTRKSRRTLGLPARCVTALVAHREQQHAMIRNAGKKWQDNDLVFASTVGTERNANNVLRSFRAVLARVDGLEPSDWTPREMRHSFVSLLSDRGMPIENISRLVGHSGSTVTERVYRHQIRPVLLSGAEVMDDIFRAADDPDEP